MVDDSGFVHLDRDGRASGTLSEHWPIGPGTYLLLHGLEADEVGGMIDSWFGPTRDGLPVVWPFCQTGGDGSMAALPGPDHGVHNEPFRRWVRETFGVQIPATANEIVPAPAEMGDKDTTDEWCRWVNAHSGLP